jgi:exodeoxyribonuclease V beta subunit
LVALIEKGEAAVREALKKIDAALICFDAAQIFTLHGFCHRMLSEFAFESKIGISLPPVESTPSSFYYKKSVEEFLLRELANNQYTPKQVRLLLKRHSNDPFKLIQNIVSLLDKEAQIASYPNPSQLCAQMSDRMRDCPEVAAELFMEDLQRHRECYKGIKESEYERQARILLEIVQKKQCSLSLLDQLLSEQESLLHKLNKANRKVKSTLPQEDSLHYPGLVENLRCALLPILNEAASSSKITLRLAKECQEFSKNYLLQRGCFSPDQMVDYMLKALDAPALLESIRKKYKAAIIDEFQDTDPCQWEIFKRIFSSHPLAKALCLVGDPKQSIYAFRNADIYTYLDAAKTLGEEGHKHLDTNFRSSPNLIAALNCLFSAPRGAGWIALPKMQSALCFEPVKAGAKVESKSHLVSRGAVHFFIASGDRGRFSQWPTKEIEEQQIFPFIAGEIRSLHQKREMPWEEIAILVKDRFQAGRLLNYLKQCGIPASFRKGSSILESPALSALKEFIAAVLDPFDESKLKIAMAGPLACWDAAMLGGRESLILQEAKIHMQFLQHTLYQKGFAFFFSQLLTQPILKQKSTILQKLFEKEDALLYHQLRKLAEILIEEEISRNLQGNDFLDFLEEIERACEEEQERFEIASQETKGSVSLMTVHLSKGLEFDTVFALSLASRHLHKEEHPLTAGPDRIFQAFDAHNPECVQALEELDAEKMRSLYVALTRAKQQVYIAAALDENDTPLSLGNASPIELFLAKIAKECAQSEELYKTIAQFTRASLEEILNRLGSLCSLTYQFVEKTQPPQPASTPLVSPLNAEQLPWVLPKAEFLFSFSSLIPHVLSEREESPDIDASGDEELLPIGSETGILVHRLFEEIFRRSLHHPLDERHIERLIEVETQNTSFEACRTSLFSLVVDPLGRALCAHSGMCLKDIPSAQLFAEFEFLFPIEGKGLMKGFADLIFLYEDKYYLLDWKTNYLGPSLSDYSEEKMVQAMEMHHYFLQASIYSRALQLYVQLFDKRPFEEIFGGALYVFLRGNGVFHFFPSLYLQEE